MPIRIHYSVFLVEISELFLVLTDVKNGGLHSHFIKRMFLGLKNTNGISFSASVTATSLVV